MSIRNLEFLLTPKSVALVGASARPGSLNALVLDRLTAASSSRRRAPCRA